MFDYVLTARSSLYTSFSFIRSTILLYLANKAIPNRNGVLDILNHMVRPRNRPTCSQACDYFYESNSLFNLINRGRGGPGWCLTTSLHLKCYIWCSTWSDIWWIFRPEIICSCQYCLMRYKPSSVHVSCVLAILQVQFYYISQYTHGQCWFDVGPAS